MGVQIADDWVIEEPTDDSPPPPPDPTEEGRPEQAPRRSRNGASFVLDTPSDVPAIWGTGTEVLWAEGEALTIVGSQGVGKSTIIQQLVRARLGVGNGQVLGHPVEPGSGRVLYLACDRPRQISRSMARMFTEDDRALLEHGLEVWPGPPSYDLSKWPAHLTRMCQDAEADTVVIDSLKDVAIGLSDDETGAGYNRARALAIAEGIQVVEAHHNRKALAGAKAAKPTLDDVYGSTWLTAGAGSVIMLVGSPGDPIVTLHHLKQPSDPVGPLKVIHDHDAGTSRVWHSTDLVLLATATLAGITARKAATALFGTDKPTPAEVEKARRRLEAHCRDGRLTKLTGDPATQTSDTYQPADRLPIGATG
jgi:hypothetical protein